MPGYSTGMDPECKMRPIDDRVFVQYGGIYPAYHMNKTHWISIAMDDRVPRVLVQDLLDQSYASTASAPRRQKKR